MSFLTGEGLRHSDSGSASSSPDNGSAYLQFTQAPDQSPLVISNINSDAFTLFSIDIAEYSAFFSTSSVSVVGYKTGGGTVSTLLSIDGVIDGTGPQADFETFSLGTGFEDLTYAEIQANGYSLDNVVGELYIVPEPHVGVLLIAGLLAVCGSMRYRHSRST